MTAWFAAGANAVWARLVIAGLTVLVMSPAASSRLQTSPEGFERLLPFTSETKHTGATRLGEAKVTGLGSTLPLGPGSYQDAINSTGSFTSTTPTQTNYQYNDSEQLKGITDGSGNTIGTVTSDSKGRITELVYGSRREKYYWNAADRMIAATQLDSNNAEIPDSATYYGYDYQGYRVSETQASDPTHPTGSVWSQGELLDEGPDTGTGSFYERAGQMVVAENGNRLIHDALGSVTGKWNGTGFDVTKYDAWGGYQEGTAPTGPPSMGYTGHLWDSSASLVYAKARWYVPELGRFTSEDPVGWEGRLSGPNGLMPFGYADGNPSLFVDPGGRCALRADGTYDCSPEAEDAQEKYIFHDTINEAGAGHWGQAVSGGLILFAEQPAMLMQELSSGVNWILGSASREMNKIDQSFCGFGNEGCLVFAMPEEEVLALVENAEGAARLTTIRISVRADQAEILRANRLLNNETRVAVYSLPKAIGELIARAGRLVVDFGGEGETANAIVVNNFVAPLTNEASVLENIQKAGGVILREDFTATTSLEPGVADMVVGRRIPSITAEGAAREAFRILKPGGKVRFSSAGGSDFLLGFLKEAKFIDVKLEGGFAVGTHP